MRKLKSLILACVWIIVALLLIWVLIAGFSAGIRNAFNHGFEYNFTRNENNNMNTKSIEKSMNNYPLISEDTFSVSDVTSINIDVITEAVYIQEAESDTFTVSVYSNMPEDLIPRPECRNGILSVIRSKRNTFLKFFWLATKGGMVEISIPKKAMDNENFTADIKSMSGSIHIDSCSMKYMDVRNTSGSIHINDCKLQKLTVKNVSGSIKCDDIAAESAETSSTSGSISFENSDISNIEMNNTSGSIRFDGSIKRIFAHNISGSIRINSRTPLEHDSSLSTVSGSIRLGLPQDSSFTLHYSNTSGSVNNNFTGFSGKKSGTDIYKDGNIRIKATSISGSIRVEEN